MGCAVTTPTAGALEKYFARLVHTVTTSTPTITINDWCKLGELYDTTVVRFDCLRVVHQIFVLTLDKIMSTWIYMS